MDETKKLNKFLSLGKMSFEIWPCIIPFNKKIHDNPGKIDETVNLILEIPNIKSSIFSTSYLPEFRKFKPVSVEIFYENFNFLLDNDRKHISATEKSKRTGKLEMVFVPLRSIKEKKINYFIKENLIVKNKKKHFSIQLKRCDCDEYLELFQGHECNDEELDDERAKIKKQAEKLKNKELPEEFCEPMAPDELDGDSIIYFEILLPKNKKNIQLLHKKIFPKKMD